MNVSRPSASIVLDRPGERPHQPGVGLHGRMCSGRTPTITSAGTSAAGLDGEPEVAEHEPDRAVAPARGRSAPKLIAGLPMNPATNMLAGRL